MVLPHLTKDRVPFPEAAAAHPAEAEIGRDGSEPDKDR